VASSTGPTRKLAHLGAIPFFVAMVAALRFLVLRAA
jgi:hypothetical protein